MDRLEAYPTFLRFCESLEANGRRGCPYKKVATLMFNGGCGLVVASYNPKLAIQIYRHST